jgi:hypothetical protein
MGSEELGHALDSGKPVVCVFPNGYRVSITMQRRFERAAPLALRGWRAATWQTW